MEAHADDAPRHLELLDLAVRREQVAELGEPDAGDDEVLVLRGQAE